jgi:hypothetical protein
MVKSDLLVDPLKNLQGGSILEPIGPIATAQNSELSFLFLKIQQH